MADDELRMIHPFWDDLNHQLDTRPRSPKARRSLKRRYKNNRSSRELRRTAEGYFKSFVGADVPKATIQGNFVQVPKNSLNIMDYVQYKGYPYTIIDQHNGAQYELGVSSIREGEQHRSGSTPLDSAYVGLHPQPYYSKNGKPMKDKNGNPVMVTARGAFTRFSQSDLGQGNGGDPLIRFIRNMNNIDTKAAYRELAHFVDDYGRETKFDPLDHSMPLPKNSQGDFTKSGNDFSINSDKPSQSTKLSGFPMDGSHGYYDFVAINNNFIPALRNTELGKKPLNHLKEMGYTDQDIHNQQIGWVPDREQEKQSSNKLERPTYNLMNNFTPGNLDFPLKSQILKIDGQGKMTNRFAGQYVRPLTNKQGKTIGIQGYDQDMNPTQSVKHTGKYSPDPLGNLVNEKNSDFVDHGHTFNQNDEKGKRFAQGYLSQKRGISPDVVNRMIDQDLIRVNLGKVPDPKAPQKLKEVERTQHALRKRKNKEAFIRREGQRVYQEEYEAIQELHNPDSLNRLKERKNVNVQSWGQNEYSKKMKDLKSQWISTKQATRGYPAYIEFAQKLPDHDHPNLSPDHQETVGADRILFDPTKDDYTLDSRQGHRGKKVVKNSMRNYGFNVSCGKQNRDNKRDLYVFEDPIDAISYLDMNRRELNLKDNPSDFLSISGSNSKINSIGNYVHHKVFDLMGDNYQRVYFGTDNDIHGQQALTEYTEKARTILPRNKVNDRFKAISAPYGKDWNDTRKHYAYGNVSPETRKKKVEYSMDEFTDRVFSDHIRPMSDEGKKHLLRINENARHLYIDYLNNGAQPRNSRDNQYFRNIQKDNNYFKNGNETDKKIYDDFKDNLQTSFTPKEIDQSFQRLNRQEKFWGQSQQRSQRTEPSLKERSHSSKRDSPSQERDPLAKFRGMSRQQALQYLRKHQLSSTERKSLKEVSAERAKRRRIERNNQLKRQRNYKNQQRYNNGPKM